MLNDLFIFFLMLLCCINTVKHFSILHCTWNRKLLFPGEAHGTKKESSLSEENTNHLLDYFFGVKRNYFLTCDHFYACMVIYIKAPSAILIIINHCVCQKKNHNHGLLIFSSNRSATIWQSIWSLLGGDTIIRFKFLEHMTMNLICMNIFSHTKWR